jgi:hypothetical protein
MSCITRTYLLSLLKDRGYNIDKEQDIPDDLFLLFRTKVEEQIRNAVRVALVSADDQSRMELEEPHDIDSILNQLLIFPKNSQMEEEGRSKKK